LESKPGERAKSLRGKLQMPNYKFQTIWCPSGIFFTPYASGDITCTFNLYLSLEKSKPAKRGLRLEIVHLPSMN